MKWVNRGKTSLLAELLAASSCKEEQKNKAEKKKADSHHEDLTHISECRG